MLIQFKVDQILSSTEMQYSESLFVALKKVKYYHFHVLDLFLWRMDLNLIDYLNT